MRRADLDNERKRWYDKFKEEALISNRKDITFFASDRLAPHLATQISKIKSDVKKFVNVLKRDNNGKPRSGEDNLTWYTRMYEIYEAELTIKQHKGDPDKKAKVPNLERLWELMPEDPVKYDIIGLLRKCHPLFNGLETSNRPTGNKAAKGASKVARMAKGEMKAEGFLAEEDDVVEVLDNIDVERTSTLDTAGQVMGMFATMKGMIEAQSNTMSSFLQQQNERARVETLHIVAEAHRAAGRPVPLEVLEQMTLAAWEQFFLVSCRITDTLDND